MQMIWFQVVIPMEIQGKLTSEMYPTEIIRTSMCYYEAYVRKYVFSSLQMTSSGFLPDQDLWKYAAPTENDTTYLNRVIQGILLVRNTPD